MSGQWGSGLWECGNCAGVIHSDDPACPGCGASLDIGGPIEEHRRPDYMNEEEEYFDGEEELLEAEIEALIEKEVEGE